MDRESLRVFLHRLESDGAVERLERGKYIVIPQTSRKGEYTLDEYVIGSVLVDPHAIAYWSALDYHGLTEQIPGTVFVQTTSRRKKQDLTIFGVRYRIVRITDYKFFGVKTVWVEDTQVKVTDREKTIIDCLDHPEYCGGVSEPAKGLQEHGGEFDLETLEEYSRRIKNTGVIRRLGYLCELYNIPISLPEVTSRNYLYLDPTMPHEGEPDSRWRLNINIDPGELA
ncbi:hypothetical protein GF319_06285 [Candidatus Bathyarchaeota archaeon]|nr:hypothetical protein [Candidatus Bathyarchaeota archaeon]